MLERGSVEGQVFHRGAVQALAPDERGSTATSSALVRKELVRPEPPLLAGRGRLPLPAPADPRRRLRGVAEGDPRRAARTLRVVARERGTELVELDEILGYHLEQTARYRAELNIDDRELGRRSPPRTSVPRDFARSSESTSTQRETCSNALSRCSRADDPAASRCSPRLPRRLRRRRPRPDRASSSRR